MVLLPRMSSNFESLANELLFDILEYLSTTDILRAFHGLNQRFHRLLNDNFQNNELDFRFLSNNDVGIICREYLPSLIGNCRSMRLIDSNLSRCREELVLFRITSLAKFSQLQSLTLFELQCERNLLNISKTLPRLTKLTELNFIKCTLYPDQYASDFFVDTVWNLPNLKRTYLNFSGTSYTLPMPLNLSSSLQQLTIHNSSCRLRNIAHICFCTPNLQYFSVCISAENNDPYILFPTTSIKTLKLFIYEPSDLFNDFFASMPELTTLFVETNSTAMNGSVWEGLIRDHLLLLKEFHLKMNAQYDFFHNVGSHISILLSSFETPFWLVERRWFVQCDYCEYDDQQPPCLYTLPYAFDRYHLRINQDGFRSYTTALDGLMYCSFDRVRTLRYDAPAPIDISRMPLFRFANVRHLTINLPCSPTLLTFVPNLHRLISLEIRINNEDVSFQLQILLRRASQIQKLIFYTSSPLYLSNIDNIGSSLRQLEFRLLNNIDRFGIFDQNFYTELSQCPLGQQCETLLIAVNNRWDILQLFHTMKNLQRLIVASCDDAPMSSYTSASTNNDDILTWLKARLPKTYVIQRERSNSSHLRIQVQDSVF